MATSLSQWDSKHRAAAEDVAARPASFVLELLPFLPMGTALDLACGTGRHTVLLAARRQPVTAVDGSAVALEILEKRARESGASVTRAAADSVVDAAKQGIRLVHANLEHATLRRSAFSLIVCVNYLQRSLFSQMERALLPGGMLLFETYTRTQLELEGGPRSPEHLLQTGELRTAFPSLRLSFYRELRAGRGIASLLAQRPEST